jgi:hypothetical protein
MGIEHYPTYMLSEHAMSKGSVRQIPNIIHLTNIRRQWFFSSEEIFVVQGIFQTRVQ